MNRLRKNKNHTKFANLQLEALESRKMLTTVELLPSMDTSLFGETNSIDNGLSNGAGEFLFIGQIAPRANAFNRRAMVAFDFSEIPANATINSVELTMTMSRTIAGDFDANLHRMTSDWGEGASDAPGPEGTGTDALLDDATWVHSFFPITEWDTPGGDFDAASSASTVIGSTSQEYSWSSAGMASDVSFWVQNPDQNFGWMILGDESQHTTAKRLNSREHSDASTHPKLVVDYSIDVADPAKISVADAVHVEGGDGEELQLSFPVTISEAATDIVTVDYALTSGTATAGQDFKSVSGTIAFSNDGVTNKSIDVTLIGDNVTELDEQFTVTLSNPAGAEIEKGTATGTIENDDAEPELIIADGILPEGNVDKSLILPVRLSHPSSFEITVDFETILGTADETDVEPQSGTLTFAPLETQQDIDLKILGDEIPEPQESFDVQLSNPVNATFGDFSRGTVTINNDDAGTPWHNANLPEDVTGDGAVVPFDALLIINELNGQGQLGAGELPPITDDLAPPPYLDVTGDNFLTNRDALFVINWLNQNLANALAATAKPQVQKVDPVLKPVPNRQFAVDIAVAALWDLENRDESILDRNQF